MARPSLSDEHRLDAMFALAEDYFRAGLFDRAERLVSPARGERRAPRAGTALPVAHLRAAARLGSCDRGSQRADRASPRPSIRRRSRTITASWRSRRVSAAISMRRASICIARAKCRRNFPRGALIRADIALDMNEPELAATLCQRFVELHPRLLALALPRVMRAVRGARCRRSGATLQRVDSSRARRARRACVRRDRRGSRAGAVRARLPAGSAARGSEPRRNRALALPAIRAQLTQQQRTDLAMSLARILRRTQRYRCVDCGFASASHFWQCPGCRSWDAFAPVALLDVTPGMQRR